MRTVSAADANRHFSKLLREVKAGETVVITSHGEPVARIEPVSEEEQDRARRQAALKKLFDRLESQPAMNIPITWTRDDIYDDDF
ncbi:type II toxin-antitoxin system Phd/YefM family antitoxin [Enterovirga aerilata]|uniref:Antitoxin n=1 Tax=Enterovirga aerilata TaxID=2730920 RepID=A0A849IAE7_9HYPH|nr:type II toxin-antitoxin system prevent-host-death family antitoxin [Enterovirga sp. DB1703]NNM70933.1 type II toxin-antitoxin system prevent-host-death family antitoxin [Enterovirga sp. DB1703]